MTDKPLVSVLIPTYNCAKYIGQAIDSVLAQDYQNLEIIVVDDGSNDDTHDVVQRIVETDNYPSLRNTVRYFHKPHSGISATRNLALEKATGEYIAWCDADDYWAEGKLKAQVEYFEKNPDCQIVFTRFQNFLENENIDTNDAKIQRVIECDKNYYYYCIHFASALIKRQIFEKCGNFCENLLFSEDTELTYRFALKGVDIFHCIDTVYYYRRLYGGNITLTKDDNAVETMSAIMKQNLLKYADTETVEKLQLKMRTKFLAKKFRQNIKQNSINNSC
ncbi:MAG: glycosyltransferase [Paludibacter sp.]|jgi:glycosyltransferase involved in cell wall biosynthesis|nr:glycosyltransferase [Paludibacter sp.]